APVLGEPKHHVPECNEEESASRGAENEDIKPVRRSRFLGSERERDRSRRDALAPDCERPLKCLIRLVGRQLYAEAPHAERADALRSCFNLEPACRNGDEAKPLYGLPVVSDEERLGGRLPAGRRQGERTRADNGK